MMICIGGKLAAFPVLLQLELNRETMLGPVWDLQFFFLSLSVRWTTGVLLTFVDLAAPKGERPKAILANLDCLIRLRLSYPVRSLGIE